MTDQPGEPWVADRSSTPPGNAATCAQAVFVTVFKVTPKPRARNVTTAATRLQRHEQVGGPNGACVVDEEAHGKRALSLKAAQKISAQ
jgi:hypothetical protein